MTPEQLEDKARDLILHIKKSITTIEHLADDQVYAILAYELWKDGRDWDDELASLAEGHPDMQFKTREDCIHFLKNIFGY